MKKVLLASVLLILVTPIGSSYSLLHISKKVKTRNIILPNYKSRFYYSKDILLSYPIEVQRKIKQIDSIFIVQPYRLKRFLKEKRRLKHKENFVTWF